MTTALEPETPKSPNLPVRLRVVEDLERSRLTVFFRLLLTIPHFLWLGIWTLGVLIVVFFGWFIVLIRGQMPDGMHRFFTMYIRYATHVNAYLNLAANPFPGFLGENGYEVDLEFDPPAPPPRAVPSRMTGIARNARKPVFQRFWRAGGSNSRSTS